MICSWCRSIRISKSTTKGWRRGSKSPFLKKQISDHSIDGGKETCTESQHLLVFSRPCMVISQL